MSREGERTEWWLPFLLAFLVAASVSAWRYIGSLSDTSSEGASTLRESRDFWKARAHAAERERDTIQEFLDIMSAEVERLSPRDAGPEDVRYVHSSGGEEHDCPHWKCEMVFTEDDETAWECEADRSYVLYHADEDGMPEPTRIERGSRDQ